MHHKYLVTHNQTARKLRQKFTNLYAISLSILLTASFFSVPASGESIAKKVLEGFQRQIARAELEYDQTLARELKRQEQVTSSAASKISEARRALRESSEVKVLKLGDSRSLWGVLQCPKARPNCIDTDKGERFQVGEVTNVKDIVIDGDLSALSTIEMMMQSGLIEMAQRDKFLSAVTTIRIETDKLKNLKSELTKVIAQASSIFEEKSQVSVAIPAIKRASKQKNGFQEAFVTAIQFEYIRKRLDELANLPFSSINSLKEFRNAQEVTAESIRLDKLNANWSLQSAKKVVSAYRQIFLKEREYISQFRAISLLYRDITGKKL